MAWISAKSPGCLSGDEHVAEWQRPANVVPVPEGKKIEDMLISGEIVAAIGVDVDHPDIKPLIPNGEHEGLKAFTNRGHFPINHTVVIKDELLEKYPDLAADVFNTFAEVEAAVCREAEGRPDREDDRRRQDRQGGDGRAGRRRSAALRHRTQSQGVGGSDPAALSQRIITKPVAVEDLFAPSTRNLKG